MDEVCCLSDFMLLCKFSECFVLFVSQLIGVVVVIVVVMVGVVIGVGNCGMVAMWAVTGLLMEAIEHVSMCLI